MEADSRGVGQVLRVHVVGEQRADRDADRRRDHERARGREEDRPQRRRRLRRERQRRELRLVADSARNTVTNTVRKIFQSICAGPRERVWRRQWVMGMAITRAEV